MVSCGLKARSKIVGIIDIYFTIRYHLWILLDDKKVIVIQMNMGMPH